MKEKNEFQKMAERCPIRCDICGSVMLAIYGCGWDNDRIVCADIESCGAEITFATSTEIKEDK